MKFPKQRNPVIEIPELMQMLEGIDLFEGVPQDKFDHFVQDLSYNIDEYEAGELVAEKGDEKDYFGIILKGEVTLNDKVLTKGDDIGLVENATSSAIKCNYVAKTKCVVLWCRLRHYVSVSYFVQNNAANIIVENLLKRCAEKAV